MAEVTPEFLAAVEQASIARLGGFLRAAADEWIALRGTPSREQPYSTVDNQFLWAAEEAWSDAVAAAWLRLPGPPPAPNRRSARATISANKRAVVFARDGIACVQCGALEPLTVDHIIPVSAGGSDDLDNLQTLCGPCNSRKGARY